VTSRLDIEYYEWLVSQIDIPNGKSYGELFERMHNWIFEWNVPNDDNRAADGMDLRNEFVDGGKSKLELVKDSATFLEVLVSLSRRIAFTAGGNEDQWAWRLIKNLRLHKMFDPLTDEKRQRIDDTLYSVIWRTYDSSGRGGFFPLNNPMEDQTKVEIWYQMNKYVIEMKAA